jgi:hypothetical protein
MAFRYLLRIIQNTDGAWVSVLIQLNDVQLMSARRLGRGGAGFLLHVFKPIQYDIKVSERFNFFFDRFRQVVAMR